MDYFGEAPTLWDSCRLAEVGGAEPDQETKWKAVSPPASGAELITLDADWTADMGSIAALTAWLFDGRPAGVEPECEDQKESYVRLDDEVKSIISFGVRFCCVPFGPPGSLCARDRTGFVVG